MLKGNIPNLQGENKHTSTKIRNACNSTKANCMSLMVKSGVNFCRC